MKPTAYLTSNLLDIIFEYKNKTYGAYELRTTYPDRLKKSLLFTTGLVIALSLLFISTLFSKHKIPITPPEKTIELANVKIKEPEPPPILPPKPPAAPKIAAQIKYTQIEVVKDQLANPQTQPPNLDQIKQNAIGIQSKAGSLNGAEAMLADGNANGVTEKIDNSKPFIFVEQMPHFPGTTTDEESNEKALAFISKHVHYPAVAREQGIEGIVSVQFVITKEGKLVDIHAIGTTPGGGLTEEAIRAIKEMPNWIPGKQNGQKVAVQFVLPIRFALNRN